MEKAFYKPQILPEYSGNPMIEALPDIWTTKDVIRKLIYRPLYHEGERELDLVYRLHCIERLFSFRQAFKQHIDIEQRISRCIRQGYIGRDPRSLIYARNLAENYQNIIEKKSIDDLLSTPSVRGHASGGFTIIGMSGVGKTTAIESILSLYPQYIEHTSYAGSPLNLKQIVWLKFDCPYDGSMGGLCHEFFAATDAVLGTNYRDTYAKRTRTIDMQMFTMRQLAELHQMGVLVIDEIQHLSLAKGGGSARMLNFFVTLVNTIGIPVILIGTNKAMSILQSEFRQARRGSGQGDLIWDRMDNDATWHQLLVAIWEFQWTREKVLYTQDIRKALYDESQGIIDIAVKLYAMVQADAIVSGKEVFDTKDIHRVAREKLQLVRPMLDALRSGDEHRIRKYEDMAPISSRDCLENYAASIGIDLFKEKKEDRTVLESATVELMKLEVDPLEAKRLVDKTLAENPDWNMAKVVKAAVLQSMLEDTSSAETPNQKLPESKGGAE